MVEKWCESGVVVVLAHNFGAKVGRMWGELGFNCQSWCGSGAKVGRARPHHPKMGQQWGESGAVIVSAQILWCRHGAKVVRKSVIFRESFRPANLWKSGAKMGQIGRQHTHLC